MSRCPSRLAVSAGRRSQGRRSCLMWLALVIVVGRDTISTGVTPAAMGLIPGRHFLNYATMSPCTYWGCLSLPDGVSYYVPIPMFRAATAAAHAAIDQVLTACCANIATTACTVLPLTPRTFKPTYLPTLHSLAACSDCCRM